MIALRVKVKGPDWQCVTPDAEWEPRDSCAELVYHDQLWLMGGWFHQSEPNPRDVWKSADGKHWEKVLHEAPWEKSDLPAFFVFNNRMWHMGGRSLPGTECSNEVWFTQDGVDWKCATDNAAWSPRLGAGCIVFKGKMWLFGGTSDFYHSNDQTLSNDIWSSTDGVNWTLECESASWSKRAYHKVVELDGKLWFTGGGACNEGGFACNDVWYSEDGVNWECALENAPWTPRFWHGSEVYRGRIWVIAGDSCPGMLGDVWFSKDGVNWQEYVADTVFCKRHEVTTYIFQDKLWVGAGHAAPLSNEVWALQLPEDF